MMDLLQRLWLVGVGGFMGAILRYFLAGWFEKIAKFIWFPSGTLAVNLLGCFFIGLLGGWFQNKEFFRPEMRFLLITGLLGSFTTFSTFGYETLTFIRDQEFLLAGMNVLIHLVVGLIAVYVGYRLSLA